MAAVTRDRDTLHKLIRDTQAYQVAAATKIFAGAMVAINASGLAVPAADAANLKVRGVALEQADNSAGAASAIVVKVGFGVFKLANAGGGDAVAQAHVGFNAD